VFVCLFVSQTMIYVINSYTRFINTADESTEEDPGSGGIERAGWWPGD